MIAPVDTMSAQLWLFDDAVYDAPLRRTTAPLYRSKIKKLRRIKPLSKCQFIPEISKFIERESMSPEMRILAGEDRTDSDLPPEMSRRERINIRNRMRSERRTERKQIPSDIRSILRDDTLSCEWLNEGELAWLDAYVDRQKAKVRALWSPAEERNRRLGITSDEIDPNEHVLPHVIEMIGDMIRLDMGG